MKVDDWAKEVYESIRAGRILPRNGARLARVLEAEGRPELATLIRGAAQDRAALLRSRGFAWASREEP